MVANNKNKDDFKLSIAKFSVLILSGLIFVVGGLIIYVATKSEKSLPTASKNLVKNNEISVKINADDMIKTTYSCGKYICVNITSSKDEEKIIILNPENLSDIKTVNFSQK